MLFLCCFPVLTWSAQLSAEAAFPAVSSYNLNKQKVTLPGGMEGRINLLILSFAPEQQGQVNSWMSVARALQHLNFHARYYELPVFDNENFVFRWWDVSSLRSDETDPESWQWIVPLFVNKRKFLSELQIPNQKQVVVLLVNREGKVLWRTSGALTPDKRQSLMERAGLY